MATPPRPRVRQTTQNTQYTYNLGRRIYDVKTYPVISPQGATILIYGHENGLTLIWRGGRRLKPAQSDAVQGRQNGAGKAAADAVMIIDSDDEEPATAAALPPFVDKPEFEDDAADDNNEYPEITQTLDLALGTAVLHVAVLPVAPCAAEDAAWGGSDILKDKMVFSVSCATNSAYVITLPLTPPSHESKAREELRKDVLAGNAGNGRWGETLTLLAGQALQSTSIAMSLVKSKTSERSKSADRTGSSSAATRVVVAAHTREACGTLRFWDVTVQVKRGGALERSVPPFQTEYLPTPLADISFNPSHATQLLVIASPQAVRLYDYSIPSLPADDASEGPFPTQGSWLLSLYPPFARGPLPSASITRKPVVAAAWVANGRAILALLADGQWGIWDIEGAGPSSGSGNSAASLFGKAGAGLRGTALTAFSVTGYLEGTSPLRTPGSQKSPGSTGEFLPMTPHTRRDAMAASLSGGPERLAMVHGGIEVTRLPPLRGSGTATGADESAVLWLGGADAIVAVIPGVSRFWDAQLRRGAGGGVNLFSGAQPTRMIRLIDLGVGLAGERCSGIGAIAKFSRARRRSSVAHENGDGADANDESIVGGQASTSEGLPVEILVRGESRLVVVNESEDGTSLTTRLLGARKKRLGDRMSLADSADAIIVYPRPEKPGSVAFNLNVSRGGSLRDARGSDPRAFEPGRPTTNLFAPPQRAEPPRLPSEVALPTRPRDPGLAFAETLSRAADAEESEGELDERAVEEEMLDVMEIDRMLEEMEEERESGRKHVFFEESSAT